MLVFVAATIGAAPATAQVHLTRFSGLVGLGGSGDGEPENGVDHPTLQVGFAFEVERELLVGARLGHLVVGGDGFGLRADPELTYVTVAGVKMHFSMTESS